MGTKQRRITRPMLGILLFVLAAAARAQDASSWLGDAGHFFMRNPDIRVSNPDGRAFTLTVHRHMWPTGGGGNKGAYQIRALGPAGKEAARGTIPSGSGDITVPAGDPRVYRIEIKPSGYGLYWVESSLERMVVCGEFHTENMLPRRWYFYVPQGTRRFTLKVWHHGTHRQDYGFFVVNPRGQRVDAVFGGKPLDMSPTSGMQPGFTRAWKPTVTSRSVDVDPGSAGRFWCIWAVGGDSHNYGGASISLEGVPSCFASAPEQWFDPDTGRPAPRLVYDESEIRRPDRRDEKGVWHEPYPVYICSPSPFLGDEDYNGWRGPHTIWLLNPENRPLTIGAGTYLASPEEIRTPFRMRVTSPKGKVLSDGEVKPRYDNHARRRILTIPASGAGVYRVGVDAVRWFPWTEPATPVVIAGQPTEDGGARFSLETGTVRQWYLRVPEGTKQFRIGVQVKDPQHALRVEIHAPNRLVDELYAKGGARQEVVVDVPPRLSGLIWFLRTELGGSTRFVSGKGNPRHLTIEADIELHGVPGFLAPTWEQWFNPAPDNRKGP